jgi:hypothetical protein
MKLSRKIPKKSNISPIKLLEVGKLILAKVKIKKNKEYKGKIKATPP